MGEIIMIWGFGKKKEKPFVHYVTKNPGSYQVGDVIGGLTVIGTYKFDPIHLFAGDKFQVTWQDEANQTILCETEISVEQSMTFDETVIVQTEFNGRKAIGALILEVKK